MKKRLSVKPWAVLAGLLVLFGGVSWVLNNGIWESAETKTAAADVKSVKISIVTNEIKWTSPDGKQEIESYRWDPGTITVNQGDSVILEFYGVKGEGHPFILEGYNLKGTVSRGKVETIMFKADKAGIFQLRCLTHPDIKSKGPMVANFVVLPSK